MIDALVPSISLDALLLKRDAAVQRLTGAHLLLQEFQQLTDALLGNPGDVMRYSALRLEDCSINEQFTDAKTLPRFIRQLDAELWDHLLTKSGLWTFMDAEARTSWRRSISDGAVPEMTRANVEATFQQLHSTRTDMLERGVLAVFKALSWDYKTNLPVKFGRRIVMTRAVDVMRYSGGVSCSVSFNAANRLDDLVRLFSVLDGKPEPDHRQGSSHQLSAVKWPLQTKDVELHGVISCRGFLNGNAHVTFLRPDLVDRMNKILARHHPNALPANREAA